MSRWHPRDHKAALDGMMRLTLEERGAYNTVLDLIYERGGPVPDDARWLAGWMGCSLRKWAALRASLIEKGKLYVTPDGGLSNLRADFELEKSAKLTRNLSESGAKGGRKRAENAAEAKENNDLGQAPPKLINNNIDSTYTEVVVSLDACASARDDWPEAPTPELAATLTQLAGPGLADPAKTGTLLTSTSEIARWRQAGASWTDDVLPVVISATARSRGDPIRAWTYFTPAVLQAAANRKTTLVLPDPIHERPRHRPEQSSRAAGRSVWADILAEEDRTGTRG